MKIQKFKILNQKFHHKIKQIQNYQMWKFVLISNNLFSIVN